MLLTRPVTKAELEPLFVCCKYCIFFQVPLTTPLMSVSFQRVIPGAAVEMVPQAETQQSFSQRGTEPHRKKVTYLKVHDKGNQRHRSLSLPSQLFNWFSSKNISRIYCGNPDHDNYVLLGKDHS